MSKFTYQGRSDETVNRRIADRGGDYDQWTKVDPIKPSEGENIYRICPVTWDAKGPWGDNWAIDIYLHWDVGADKATYLCARKMHEVDPALCPEDRCPICEMVDDLNDEDLRKRLKAKRSLLAYVIDRKDEKAGPQIWRLGKQLEGNLQFRSKDKKTGAALAIDHPERGYDISFTRVGTDEKTKYTNEDVDRDSTYLCEDQKREEKWLDFLADHPLPTQLNFYPYDHIAKVVKGRSSRKTNDEDSETRTRRPRRGEEAAEEADPRDRGRGRETTADETPRERERTRSREESEERPARRTRDEEPDEREGRPRAREPELEPETRRRPGRDEAADEGGGNRRQRPSRDEEPAPRERAHRARTEEEDEIPSERSRRAAPEADEGEEEPVDEKPSKTTDRARASIARLKPKDK